MSKTDINYLKGLAEGQKIDEKSDEGKIIMALIDIVQEQNETIEQLKTRIEDVEEFRDDLDDSFNEADQFLRDLLSSGSGLPFMSDDFDFDLDDDDDEEDDMDLYEVECPKCKTSYYASFEDFIDDDVVCPNCGKHYELSDDVITKLVKDNFDE